MRQANSTPRGIRNNNPLNIRVGNTWLGEVQQPTDMQFEQFVSMEYGYRAAFVLLRRYIRRYKLNTIRKIISTWAPSSENNTSAYIKKVSEMSQIPADLVINYEDKSALCNIVYAMTIVENGQHVDMAKIAKGYDMA